MAALSAHRAVATAPRRPAARARRLLPPRAALPASRARPLPVADGAAAVNGKSVTLDVMAPLQLASPTNARTTIGEALGGDTGVVVFLRHLG